MLLYCDLDDLRNESDVEQKFLYPLLTGDAPLGLGISQKHILTKANLRHVVIGKGNDKKTYYPDYVIAKAGIPMAVIEAKAPETPLTAAFREARLYAHELNALFKAGTNPVSVVVACNGHELWLGQPDHQSPSLKATYLDIIHQTETFASIEEQLGAEALKMKWGLMRSELLQRQYWKPRLLLGGRAVQDEALPKNAFGRTISSRLVPIFNPETRAERAKVVQTAYITSTRRSRYVQPIDALIRAASPRSHADARLIEQTSNPTALLEKLSDRKNLEQKVLLIIGGAGAGKTTFIDYLQEVALPKDLREATLWLHLNMNHAPGSKDEIFDWIRKSIIQSVQDNYPELDFDELDTVQSLYSVEINKFRKTYSELYKSEETFLQKLGEKIEQLQSDLHGTAMAHCRFCGGERGRLVIIILDNCDKRERDLQLLMFEVAQWLKREFRALVMLPLRDETYDNHRDEPPLDTALKDLVFRIEPPAFHDVLAKRVELARAELQTDQRSYRYDLENSMHVDYDAADQGRFLTSIVSSLFSGDRNIGRLLVGLAGSNLRRAFEMFLEICNSGHIPSSEMLKIKNSQGVYNIPLHYILRALLRQNRRFYDSDHTYIKNLMPVDPERGPSHPFLRIVALSWLKQRSTVEGPSRLKGYFPLSSLIADLSVIGYEQDEITDAIRELTRAYCVLTEDFRSDNLEEHTLIKIGPAGIVHLELIENINYWSAISEDLFYDRKAMAQEVCDAISDSANHYSKSTSYRNGRTALKYIESKRCEALESIDYLPQSTRDRFPDFSSTGRAFQEFAQAAGLDLWETAELDLPVGTVIKTQVARTQPYGFFVDFETSKHPGRKGPKLSGLVRYDDLPPGTSQNYRAGDRVTVKVTKIDPRQRKIHLELVRQPSEQICT